MLSFWENQHFVQYDYIIVGGGIVGLSTAASLAERHPQASILVLERGIFPTGASTKNAGFACFGSLTELLSDIDNMGADQCMALVEERWKGLLKLRSRLGDDGIGYLNYGGYELIREKEVHALERTEEVNEMLRPIFKAQVFGTDSQSLTLFGFAPEGVEALMYNAFEGQIDTGKMMRSLLQYVASKGVHVLSGTTVDSFEDQGNSVLVEARSGNQNVQFKAGQLIICTNAFTKALIPSVEMAPGRGIVLVTQPIENLKFKGVFHYDEGYFYFRNYENRVIFGGGRNLDITGEATTAFEINEQILDKLKSELSTLILPNQNFEIDQTWAGIMSFGSNKQPILKQLSDRVVIGVRLGGMGVAIGSQMGERIAEMVS